MAGKKLVEKALQAAMEARADKYVADPAKRAANLAKWQANSPAQVAEPTWYHGTTKNIEGFDPDTITFLSPSPRFASNYSNMGLGHREDWMKSVKPTNLQPNVMPVRVRAENPFDYENPEHIAALDRIMQESFKTDPHVRSPIPEVAKGSWETIEATPIQEAIRKLGHDAFFINEDGVKNLAVYNPERQLKSATGNLGTFDPNIERLTEADGGAVEREHHADGERVTGEVKFDPRELVVPPQFRAMPQDAGVSAGGEGKRQLGELTTAAFAPSLNVGPVSGGPLLVGVKDYAQPIVGYQASAALPEGFRLSYGSSRPADVPSKYSSDTISLAKDILGTQVAAQMMKQGDKTGYGVGLSRGNKDGATYLSVQRPPMGGVSVMGGREFRFADGGEVYQSTGEKLVGDENKINWGDPNEARDFFRADAEMMRRLKAEEDAKKPTTALPRGASSYASVGDLRNADPILRAIRMAESSNDVNAQNPKSSAGGLFGFINSTWVNTLRRMDPQRYGNMSDAELVALKKGPQSAAIQQAAADYHLRADIAPTLSGANIPLTPGNIYLGWFQGPQGAVTANTAPPDARVADLFPNTVGPNAAVRFNGKPYAEWTIADLRAWADAQMARRMGRAEGGEVDQAMHIVREPHAGGKAVGKLFDEYLSKLMGYKDAPAKRIADWQWRALPEVAKELNLTEIPPHVQDFGKYMREMSEKAGREGLSSRDLIKGYTTTRASIQRRATDADRLRDLGLDLPSDVKTIRPEGAWAEWLMTPMGKRYLDAASKGTVEGDAVANAIKIMSPFGRHETDIPDSMMWAAKNLPGREQAASDLVYRAAQGGSSPEEWRAFTSGIRGVGPSKSGFLASLYGRGDQPTLDARQIILNTGAPTKEASRYIARGGGEGGVEAVDRLAARQRALDLDLPSEYDPYYQHLAHHAIWDKASNEMTTHDDVVRAMRYADGGEVDQAMHIVREHHAEGQAVGETSQKDIEAQRALDLANSIRAYERSIREIEAQPEEYRSMTHRPRKPLAPVQVEGGFIGKKTVSEAPYDVAGTLSKLYQLGYDLKTVPLYAAGTVFPPAAALGTAIDTAEGVASGSAGQVAMGALGTPGRVVKNVIAPLSLATGALSPDEAQAGKDKMVQQVLDMVRGQRPAGSRVTSQAGEHGFFVPQGGRERDPRRWHPISNTVLSRPLGEMHAEYVATGPAAERKFISPQELERAALIPALGDRTAGNSLLTAVNETRLETPVEMQAGNSFMFGPAAKGSDKAVWASDPGIVSALANKTRAAAEAGYDPYLSFVAMGNRSGDYSHHMTDTLRGLLPSSKIDKSTLAEFDRQMRENTANKWAAYEDWPGLKSKFLTDYLYGEGPAKSRTKMAELMGQGQFQKAGMPDVGAARFAITDPALLHAEDYSAGHSIAKLDPTGRVIKDPAVPHKTYKVQLGGEGPGYVGGFEYDIPFNVMNKEWIDKMMAVDAAKYANPSQLAYTYRMHQPTTFMTPEVVDRLSTFIKLKKEGLIP